MKGAWGTSERIWDSNYQLARDPRNPGWEAEDRLGAEFGEGRSRGSGKGRVRPQASGWRPQQRALWQVGLGSHCPLQASLALPVR